MKKKKSQKKQKKVIVKSVEEAKAAVEVLESDEESLKMLHIMKILSDSLALGSPKYIARVYANLYKTYLQLPPGVNIKFYQFIGREVTRWERLIAHDDKPQCVVTVHPSGMGMGPSVKFIISYENAMKIVEGKPEEHVFYESKD